MAYPFNTYTQPYYPQMPQQAYNTPYQQQQATQQGQMMTPPTIHAEIVQVAGEDEAKNYPVGAGASQMMINRDDSAIYIKSANANGYDMTVYIKRPPAPPAPAFDPEKYITKEDAEALIAKAVQEALK